MTVRIKRVYDPPAPDDGARFLVDRNWPRGIRKQDLPLDGWLRDLAPSGELCGWYGGVPARWDEFVARYHRDLDRQSALLTPIRAAARLGNVTLLYSAKDTAHNSAVALRAYLERDDKPR